MLFWDLPIFVVHGNAVLDPDLSIFQGKCRALEDRQTTALGEPDFAAWLNKWNRSYAVYRLDEQHEDESEGDHWGDRDHDDDYENGYAVSSDAHVGRVQWSDASAFVCSIFSQ